MAEIVNLRRARKNKARQQKQSEAEANRAKFGTPVQLRKQLAAERESADKKIDGHKLDRNEEIKRED